MRKGYVLYFKLKNADKFEAVPLRENEAWDLYAALKEVLEHERKYKASGFFSVERYVICDTEEEYECERDECPVRQGSAVPSAD